MNLTMTNEGSKTRFKDLQDCTLAPPTEMNLSAHHHPETAVVQSSLKNNNHQDIGMYNNTHTLNSS
jgi:hypothetical protein